jgi:hypothetical protein
MMELIAKYREEWSGRRCSFELFPGEVRARGQTPASEFETTIPLSGLQPRIDRLWEYGLYFYSGIICFVVSFVGLLVVAVGQWKEVPFGVYWVLIGTGIVGVVFVVANLKKLEKVVFSSDAGVPMLMVVRAGKQEGEFDQFVALILEQIKKARTPQT